MCAGHTYSSRTRIYTSLDSIASTSAMHATAGPLKTARVTRAPGATMVTSSSAGCEMMITRWGLPDEMARWRAVAAAPE